MVIQGGKILYEHYFGGFGAHDHHLWASSTKSMVSSAAGILVDRGVQRYLSKFKADTAREPGAVLDYQSPNVDVLGWLVARLSGVPLQTFVAEEIWGRLGVEHDAFFITDLAYAPIATGGFNTTLRDAARFGLAVLHGGRVGDRQVLAADWVEQSFQVRESDREAARRSIFLDPENPAYFPALEAYRNF